ncbi:uncharacterized protein LOC135479486 [Liolophura sinensis]|uniref:uncharacterized protein LOC135479486 n=1 Tax=Liolophura sinensis TaxID=3198878 RepID=UPI0031584035
MATIKSPMLNGGQPTKDLDVPFSQNDSSRQSRPLVETKQAVLLKIVIVVLLGINFILALVAVALAAAPQVDTDGDQCNGWKNNASASFTELLNQVTDDEVGKPQMHYLGWGRNFDPDADPHLEETRERSEQAHFITHIPCPENDPKDTNGYETLCWNQTCEKSFCNSPLKYESGKIRVHSAAYYFIYSRLLFDVSNVTEEWMSLTHDIMRQQGSRTQLKILETQNVITEPRKDNVRSYLGAAFYLFGGDLISVRVNTRSRPYLSHEDVYFGMFRI